MRQPTDPMAKLSFIDPKWSRATTPPSPGGKEGRKEGGKEGQWVKVRKEARGVVKRRRERRKQARKEGG